jgi:hypothetical protein
MNYENRNNWKLEFEESTGLVKVGASDYLMLIRHHS